MFGEREGKEDTILENGFLLSFSLKGKKLSVSWTICNKYFDNEQFLCLFGAWFSSLRIYTNWNIHDNEG